MEERLAKSLWAKSPKGKESKRQSHRRRVESGKDAEYRKQERFGRYGLTEDQYNKILEEQDYRCAICQRLFGGMVRAVIDHDHTCCAPRPYKRSRTGAVVGVSCGKCVRGLLCTGCNSGLGMFEDAPQRLVSALNYLEASKPQEFLSRDLSLEALDWKD